MDDIYLLIMGSNTIGDLFQVTTFGESHGHSIGCIVDNCPSGVSISENEIQKELDRRKPGQSKISTPRQEPDKVKIISGIFEGKSMGTPITMIVENENASSKDYTNFSNIYRPSHADYTYDIKYKHRTPLGGGRASARTTIGVVAAGAIAKKILHIKLGVKIVGYVSQVYKHKLPADYYIDDINLLQKMAESHPTRCPDKTLAEDIYKLIQETRRKGDSLGGVVNVRIDNIPPGIGDPVFKRLDALLAYAMLSIPASKGVSFGTGFESAELYGSEHNDIFYVNNNDQVRTKTNHSGGIQGGISNGESINMSIVFKPTATISKEQDSITTDNKKTKLKVKGRHDPCVLPRAVPIVEAFSAIILLDRYLSFQLSRLDQLQ